jgi:hypothetical protein
VRASLRKRRRATAGVAAPQQLDDAAVGRARALRDRLGVDPLERRRGPHAELVAQVSAQSK